MEDITDIQEKPARKYINVLVTILLILTVMLCMYVVVQVLSRGYVNIGGFMLFRVVTGSMEPEIPVGSLMITRETDISTIVLDDIICFRTQDAQIWGKIVTHRVVGVLEAMDGSVLLETKGDANLVMDGYYVTADNFVGKVIWYTGENNMLADVFSFFTNKVGFLACIVFPCLLLASLILRECVRNIRSELKMAMEELEECGKDPLLEMTPEEYQEMYDRIRAELIEELMQSGQFPEKE